MANQLTHSPNGGNSDNTLKSKSSIGNRLNDRKKIIPIVFFTIFLDMLGMGILIPVFPMLVAPSSPFKIIPDGWTIGEGYILGGWLLAAFPIMQFFFSPVLGQLSDRIGRKKILTLAILGSAVSYALFALGIMIGCLPLMFFSRILDGATGGNISVAQAVIGDVSKPKDRAKNFGLIGVALGLGFILGPYLGGKLSDSNSVSWFSLTTPFWFAMGLSLLNTLYLLVKLPETLKQKNPEPIVFRKSLFNIAKGFTLPELRPIIPAQLMFNSGWTFFTTFWGVVLAEEFLFSQGNIGNYFGYMGIMIVLAQGGLVRRLSGKATDYKVMRLSMPLTFLCVLPYFFIPGEQPGLIYWFPPFMAAGMALTRAFGTALLTRVSPELIRGEVMGIHSSAYALAQVIPSLLAGYVAAQDARLPILVGVIVSFVGWLYFVTMYRESESKANS